jgi:hypothetical protein
MPLLLGLYYSDGGLIAIPFLFETADSIWLDREFSEIEIASADSLAPSFFASRGDLRMDTNKEGWP